MYRQRLSYFSYVFSRYIAFSSLDAANISSMQLGFVRQRFLTKPQSSSVATNISSDDLKNVFHEPPQYI